VFQVAVPLYAEIETLDKQIEDKRQKLQRGRAMLADLEQLDKITFERKPQHIRLAEVIQDAPLMRDRYGVNVSVAAQQASGGAGRNSGNQVSSNTDRVTGMKFTNLNLSGNYVSLDLLYEFFEREMSSDKGMVMTSLEMNGRSFKAQVRMYTL